MDFADKLKANREIFKAFYINDESAFRTGDQDIIASMNEKILLWVKELYWASLEVTRKKSEEEKIANILMHSEIYETIKKLAEGPVTLDDLDEWFVEEFPKADFDKTRRSSKRRNSFI